MGILQGTRNQSTDAIHSAAPIALFKACHTAGVKRILQISAQGASLDAKSVYGQSKNAADYYLETQCTIEYAIIKPSLVYATGSYGGTSLFRGLAAMPGFIPVPGNGHQVMQPIAMNDLCRAVHHFTTTTDDIRTTVDAVGPEILTLRQIFSLIRIWLGFGPARCIPIPMWLLRSLAWLSERLNQGGPITTTSLSMLNNSITVDSVPFVDATQINRKRCEASLEQSPSHVQDRWHARLYFLAPLLKWSLVFLWVLTGVYSLTVIPLETSLQALAQMGFNRWFAMLTLWGGSILDIILGLLLLTRWRQRGILLQCATLVFYTTFIAFNSPVGMLTFSLLKNIPSLVATIILAVLLEER